MSAREVATGQESTGAEPADDRPRSIRWSAPAATALALAGVVSGLLLTGAAAPTALVDPGAVVRWGLPMVTALTHLAAVLTIGCFVLCAVVLAPGPAAPGSGAQVPAAARPAWQRASTVGTVAAIAWTLLQTVQLVLTHLSVSGGNPGGSGYVADLAQFLTATEVGRMLGWAVVLTAVTAVVAAGVSSLTAAPFPAALGLLSLVPAAATGHAAGASDHDMAVSALWLHLAAVAIWVGGLAALVLVAPRTGSALPRSTERYSTLAGWCFVVVALSGAANAWTRLETPAGLVTSPWGQLLLVKLALFLLLGAAGWWHRRATLPVLRARAERPGAARSLPFWRLAGAEVTLMGGIVGVSVALGSSAPPDESAGAAAVLGASAPPPPTPASYLTQGQLEPVFALLAVAGAAVYLTWVLRLRRRGDHWPVGRSISWLLGMALFAWLTNGGAAVYGQVLFSAHMIQHMSLVMVLPILLVLAAPVTLALRALPRRRDGSLGPREWLLKLVHSRWAQFFAHPAVAAVNVVLSMALFYLTPLFELAMSNHLAHLLMIVHFALVGYLFVNVLVGTDPGPRRPPYPVRLVLLLPSMLFHSFFGLFVMSSSALLGGASFVGTGAPWAGDPVADQQVGGAFTWAMGELPALALALVIALRWAANDERALHRAAVRARA